MAQAEGVQPLGQVLRQIERALSGAGAGRRADRAGGDRRLYRIKWLGEDGKVREVTAGRPHRAHPRRSAEPESRAGRTMRVLVVEDDPRPSHGS